MSTFVLQSAPCGPTIGRPSVDVLLEPTAGPSGAAILPNLTITHDSAVRRRSCSSQYSSSDEYTDEDLVSDELDVTSEDDWDAHVLGEGEEIGRCSSPVQTLVLSGHEDAEYNDFRRDLEADETFLPACILMVPYAVSGFSEMRGLTILWFDYPENVKIAPPPPPSPPPPKAEPPKASILDRILDPFRHVVLTAPPPMWMQLMYWPADNLPEYPDRVDMKMRFS